MAVLKYNKIRYENGGVDISNMVDIRKSGEGAEPLPDNEEPAAESEQAAESRQPPEPRFSAEEILAQKETELILKKRELEQKSEELSKLREQYIEQGKEVILEAKRRAQGIIDGANGEAEKIVAEAEKSRDDIFIKAKAEGYEQGKKDGVALIRKEGQHILNEARDFSEDINAEKARLFAKYEKDIFDTVMAIANKVTMDSMSVKDGTAAKKLIKAAAKEFRNSQIIRVSLDENGASAELMGDYEYLKELCGGAEHVEIELLKDAEPGTVIVDNGEEITDAGIMTQLKMIRELGDGKFRNASPKKRGSIFDDDDDDIGDFDYGGDEE